MSRERDGGRDGGRDRDSVRDGGRDGGREREGNPDCKVFVGGLAKGADERELEDAFCKYGRIENVWISRDRPGFGFVMFEV